MERSLPEGYPVALWLGAIAGMRSLLAPAALAQWLREHPESLAAGKAYYLERLGSLRWLERLSLLELAADKLPMMPDRIRGTGLLGRLVSGTVCGVAASRTAGGRPLVGALLGLTTAAAATFGSYHLRHWLCRRLRMPDALVGTLEDSLALYLASRLPAAARAGGPMDADAKARLRGRWSRRERYQA
jgi:uncharacterized membrane protein